MSEKIQIEPISGFPEWVPNVRLAEEQFINTIREQYQLYGFTPIETAAVERFDVLTAKGGIQRQIYTVGKPEEGKSEAADLGLHFDLTVPLARYVVQNADKLNFPFRRYQIQKVWRGEHAQRGRFREFYQCDVDIIGRDSLDIIHDAEIPCVINATFEALKLPDFRVQISNRKILADLLRVEESSPEQLASVLRVIDKSDRDGLEKTGERLQQEQVSDKLRSAILDLIQAEETTDARSVLQAIDAEMTGIEELSLVVDRAVDLGMPRVRLRPNFAIARGLDYYTGTIYETYLNGKEDWGSICSGGRYDDLAAYFTQQKYPGVGISIGLTRLFNLLVTSEMVDTSRHTPTRVLVTMLDRESYLQEYLQMAGDLRSRGIPTQAFLEPAKLRKQLSYANANGIPFAVIAGEDEIANGNVQVKDLLAGEQAVIPREQLADYILQK